MCVKKKYKMASEKAYVYYRCADSDRKKFKGMIIYVCASRRGLNGREISLPLSFFFVSLNICEDLLLHM